LVGLQVENFNTEIAMLQPVISSPLQSVMHNSTGDIVTKYPQSNTNNESTHRQNKRASDGGQLGGVHGLH